MSDEITLSDREIQVLTAISYGNTNGAIGEQLHVSEDTVKSHVRSIFKKLGVTDRSHAVRVGLELRILTTYAQLRTQTTRAELTPLTARGYSDTHIAACFAAEACPCRRSTTPPMKESA